MIIMTDMDKAELKKALGVDELEKRVKELEEADSSAQSSGGNT